MKRKITFCLTCLFMLFAMNYALFAQSFTSSDIPRIFDYQGILTNSQGEPYNGEFDLTFTIINVETNAVLYQETVENLQVENGLVHHLIGSVADTLNPFIFQNATALRIKINEETLAPDVAIAPAPVAMMALYADSINHTVSQQEVITEKIRVNSIDTAIVAISQNGPTIVAISRGSGGNRSFNQNNLNIARINDDDKAINGVSDNGVGVQGVSKNNIGVHGKSESGTGMHGKSKTGIGVNGASESSYGTVGQSKTGDGVYGNSESGAGTSGQSTTGDGVWGWSDKGNGVKGHSEEGNGGSFSSKKGYAIYAKKGTGLAAAYFDGDVNIANGRLVLKGAKIRMDKDGEIYARSFHTMKRSGGLTMALQDTVITSGIDSLGNATFTSVEAFNINSENQIKANNGFVVNRQDGGRNEYGPWGVSFSDADGSSKGLWSSASGNFHTAGNYTAQGTKNAIVNTENYGKRKLYADESADVRFFDRGESQLEDGKATILFDPMFLETVTIDKNNPALVQITLTSDCNGVFVAKRTSTHFVVKELMSGTSNASFMWEVSAKRKGYESVRMEAANPSITLK